jgi:L-lysine exporter family protein LysE/ArgO
VQVEGRSLFQSKSTILTEAFIAGFALGLGLILVIGAQNVFVIRQGIMQRHVFVVCLTCALSDAVLISIGVSGFHFLESTFQQLELPLRIGGAVFLFIYGALILRRAYAGTSAQPMDDASKARSLKQTIFAALAFAWLNPHVYFDTVVLLGTVSTQYVSATAFAIGASLASFVFFFALGYGARMLKPFFERPEAWRGLDIFFGLLMWAIGLKILTT